MYKGFALMHVISVMYRVAILLGCGNLNNADMADVTGAHKLQLSSQSLGSFFLLVGVWDYFWDRKGIFPLSVFFIKLKVLTFGSCC